MVVAMAAMVLVAEVVKAGTRVVGPMVVVVGREGVPVAVFLVVVGKAAVREAAAEVVANEHAFRGRVPTTQSEKPRVSPLARCLTRCLALFVLATSFFVSVWAGARNTTKLTAS